MPAQRGRSIRTVLKPITTAERAAMTVPHVGLIGPDVADDSLYWWTGRRFARIVDRDVIPDQFDAIVDSDAVSNAPEVYLKAVDAIDADHESIFVNAMGRDTAAITIAAARKLVRFQGKDGAATEILQDMTCSKDDVIFENFELATQTLTLNANRIAAHDLLLTGTGDILFTATGTLKALYLSRAIGTTATPITVVAGASGVLIERVFFLSGSGTASIQCNGNGVTNLEVSRCIFSAGMTNMIAFVVAGTGVTRSAFKGNQVLTAASQAGFDIYGSENTVEDNTFIGSGAGDARQLRLNSGVGIDIETRVVNNNFIATAGSHILFECISADGDGAGLLFMGNVAPNGGTFRGHQDMIWIGNDLRGCTLDFLSKTGQIIVGGDLTGATLSNIPSDIVFRGVKGQDDRGDYLPVDGAVDLGSDVKRFAELWLSSNADIEGNLQLDGNLTVDGDVVGDLVPSADDTYDLGAAGKEWKDLYVDGTANIDTASIGAGSFQSINVTEGIGLGVLSDLNPGVDSLYDLGTSGRRYALGYIDDLTVTTDIVVGGTVDGVDIATEIQTAIVQASAPTPRTGLLWLDTSVSGTGTESLALVTKTGAYTATDSDTVILCDASGGAFTITLPTAVGRSGKVFYIKKTDSSANAVTTDGDGSETIDGATTQVIATQYNAIKIISDGSEWHIL